MQRLSHSLWVDFRHAHLMVWVTLIIMPVAWVHAAEWKLGGVKGAIGGQYSSLRFDEYGNAHVCSFSQTNGMLSYSFWDHRADKWFSTQIDKGGNFCSLALDSKQRPHISYLFNAGLHYAHWNGNSLGKTVDSRSGCSYWIANTSALRSIQMIARRFHSTKNKVCHLTGTVCGWSSGMASTGSLELPTPPWAAASLIL